MVRNPQATVGPSLSYPDHRKFQDVTLVILEEVKITFYAFEITKNLFLNKQSNFIGRT